MTALQAFRRDTTWRRAGFVVQRASGLGVLAFLVLHVGDTSLVVLDPSAYNAVVALYKKPVFDAVEIALVGPLIFHAFNGLRIVVQDLWAGWVDHQAVMLRATYATTVAAWVVFAYFMAVK
ncbi:MAG TPA: hypothetical protein VE152_00675 [Acidimicrobiales bacterium]|jgi:succinate dehydrogenase / fumarate reductase cytochrome b subunit|nr:hypothetical protein [Acidimicrobiales bacterium]